MKLDIWTCRPYAEAETAIDEKIQDLRDELVDLNQRAQTIQASADAEKRTLSEDEEKEVNSIFDQFGDIEAEIERREMIAAQSKKLSQSAGRRAAAQEPQASADDDDDIDEQAARQMAPRRRAQSARARESRIEVISPPRGRWGFRTFGDFAQVVRASSHKGAQVDQRLIMNAPTSVSTEGVGADGGFLVPPDYRAEIWQKVAGEESLISRTDQWATSKNSIVVPADETTPWDSSGGIQAYFESEAGQITQSKVALKDKTLRLNKLTALIPVSEELFEDAAGLDAYLRKKVGEKFDFKLTLKLIQGTGAGEPLGILNANSLVSVAKESGQAADTVVTENINKMYARMYAPLIPYSIWLINQDVQPQLDSMTLRVLNAAGTDYVGGGPVYMPPGGLADAPYGRLKGRPVIPTQGCETLGDKGDIIFVALKEYWTGVKSGGIRSDVSIHLWFDYDVMAYRFILRIGGMPWWKDYITPRDGTNYLSWAVTLDERASG